MVFMAKAAPQKPIRITVFIFLTGFGLLIFVDNEKNFSRTLHEIIVILPWMSSCI